MEIKADNIFYVQMFGNFEIKYKNVVLNSEQIRSEMTELLLIFLLCHHRKEITMQEVCENLWEEDTSDNPIGALKNLMYRLRTLLKKSWDDEFVITGRGTYSWNPEIKVEIDIETFDLLLKKVTNEKPKNSQKLLEEAIALYKDSFLVKHNKQHWIIQQSTYYQSQYMTAIKKLSEYYLYREDFEKLELLCNRALLHDNFDESIHYLLIFCYVKQGKRNLALEHYHATTKFLYEELGTQVSKELQDIYKELLKQKNSTELDLSIIQHDLDEALRPVGAFICEYGVFKEIYRLQARQSSRLGMSIYCGLLTASVTLNIPQVSDMYKKIMSKSMEHLHEIIRNTLRVGDTASRYSVSQFVILLPTCTYESAIFVMERLIAKYKEIDSSTHIALSFDVKELHTKENTDGK